MKHIPPIVPKTIMDAFMAAPKSEQIWAIKQVLRKNLSGDFGVENLNLLAESMYRQMHREANVSVKGPKSDVRRAN